MRWPPAAAASSTRPSQGQRLDQQKFRLFPLGSAFEEVSGTP